MPSIPRSYAVIELHVGESGASPRDHHLNGGVIAFVRIRFPHHARLGEPTGQQVTYNAGPQRQALLDDRLSAQPSPQSSAVHA